MKLTHESSVVKKRAGEGLKLHLPTKEGAFLPIADGKCN